MAVDTTDTKVGFVGLGIMGASMAGHILEAGFELHVNNRTKAKADDLVARGAHWHDGAGDVATAADVVITMLGFPADVEEIYLGADGIVARAGQGALLIDMTTSSPSLAARIAEAAAARGQRALDAPVSGGDVGAREGKLAIMAGGDAAAFDDAMPLFRIMGENIRLLGPAGAGQHTKMANQIVIASTIMGVCEGLAYARQAGLDAKEVLQAIGTGAAGGFQLNVLGPRILDGDFAPGFFVRHFLKDMGIAIDEADDRHLELPGLKLSRSLFDKLAEGGGEEDGTQGLYRLYDR